MPSVGSARRVLAFRLGISAIFDVTGATVLRLVRRSLPEPPDPGTRPDPFVAAMDTIMAAHRELAPMAAEREPARKVARREPTTRAQDKAGVVLAGDR
jgi:hypothetical protein